MGRLTTTIMRIDDAIIVAAKISSIKSFEVVQSDLLQEDKIPSQRTIRRYLFDPSLKSYKPSRKPRFTSKNISGRLAFCQKYKNCLSDEKKETRKLGPQMRTFHRDPYFVKKRVQRRLNLGIPSLIWCGIYEEQ
ncbi:---NA--- [Octopus vulgaris]|uniref:---NA n=1 Tax=Octopus vulgaris TaxID=6645 RepID=A0AA36AZ02_OCTVU|nr:---NA--- [Octopus vulgaris]